MSSHSIISVFFGINVLSFLTIAIIFASNWGNFFVSSFNLRFINLQLSLIRISSSLILFSEKSQYSKVASVPRYVLGELWYGSEWIKFLRQNADSYLEKMFRENSVNPPEIYVVYTLGYLGKVDFVENDDVFKSKLTQTLRIFYEERPDISVVIKPHFNTDVHYLRNIVDAFDNNNFFISNLHPAILASRASLFLGNYYSTSMGVAKAAGLKVVEFSKYNDSALSITRGKGMRPDIVDVYINDNEDVFRRLVKKIPSTSGQLFLPDCKRDSSGLTDILSGI